MTSDIFSTQTPNPGTYFTAHGTMTSGLFTDLHACAEWTYHHFDNSRYAIPVWERVRIIGEGPLTPDQPEEILRRIRSSPHTQGLHRDFVKGVFGCIAQGATGQFFEVYGFPTRASAQDFAKAMGGTWMVATMVDWVSMY